MRAHNPLAYRTHRALLTLTITACFAGAVLLLQMLSPPAANATGDSACPASNPPNELMLAGGTPQTAQLNAEFAGPFQVTLANTNDCPLTEVIGTPITFTAPSTGAGGSFHMSGSNKLTVGADSQGAAQAGSFTANDTPGTYTVTASSAYGTVSFALTNSPAGLPTKITPLAPTNQSARTNTRYRNPLSVRVTDADGAPVVGTTVTFSVGHTSAGAGGGGTGNAPPGASFTGGAPQAIETTNSTGVATSPRLTANDTAGAFTAVASVAHLTQAATFRLRNVAETLTLRRVGRRPQTATVDTGYSHPLQVRVTRAGDQPVEGATVSFTLSSAGSTAGSSAAASFDTGAAQATATTSANGIATSPRFAANSIAGTLRAIVTLQGTSTTIRLGLRNTAARLRAVGRRPQTATVDTGYSHPLQVRVTRAGDQPVEGATVSFTLSSAGSTAGSSAAASFDTGAAQATATTSANGIATSPRFAANSIAGTLRAIVTLQGTSTTIRLGLRNTAARLRAVGRRPQTATVDTGYSHPLQVRVTRAGDQPVEGATVSFTLSSAGSTAGSSAAASFDTGAAQATATTSANGIATSPRFAANSIAGTLRAIVTLQGTSTTIRLGLRNTAARLRAVGRRPQTATVDTGYSHPLQVRVTRAGDQPVEGATVSFTLSSAGSTAGSSAAASFDTGAAQATATTSANGIATSPRFAANSIAGTLRAIVTLQGTSTTIRLGLRNTAALPMTVIAGVAANESTTIGNGFPIPLAVTVTDAHDNPVPDAPVTFTAPATGASGRFQGSSRVTVRTDTRGIAVAPGFTGNHTPGGYVVKATTGDARAAAFALVNQQP